MLTALLAVAAACSDAGSDHAGARPNVVLVSIDSLRADHVGCYGYARDTTPFLDSLAARGVRFETAVSTTSWTLPAHAAMLTGLQDVTHGVLDNGLALSEGHRTLAEMLRAQGYDTAGFYGGPYLHPIFGFGQGFDVYQSCMDPRIDLANPHPNPNEHATSHADVTGPRTRRAVQEWADARGESDDPYFLFLHLWDVHYDFVAPAEYVDQFIDPDYSGLVDGRLMTNPAIHPGMSAADRAHVLGLYDAEIRFTDDVLKGIWADLEQRGMAENTLVVVTSDHGEEFFEHGQKGHNQTLFDEVVRVPLVVYWQGGEIEAGTTRPEQVQIVDIVPTVAFAAGMRERFVTQGRNLGPGLFGRSLVEREALLELSLDHGGQRALRSLERKIYRVGRPGAPVMEFDLLRDPAERKQRTASEEGQQELSSALTKARRLRDQLGSDAESIADNPALQRELEALGYLGGSEEER